MDEKQMAKAILYQLTRIADADEKKLYQQTRIADALASISMMAQAEKEEWHATSFEYDQAPAPDETLP